MLLSIVINYVGGLLAGTGAPPGDAAARHDACRGGACAAGLVQVRGFLRRDAPRSAAGRSGAAGDAAHRHLLPSPFRPELRHRRVPRRRRGAARPAQARALHRLFPQLVAGPIVRYTTVAEEIDERHESVSEFSAGAVRFLFGLGKKMLLANAVARIADAAFAAVMPSVLFAWLGAVAYTFQIYFDFFCLFRYGHRPRANVRLPLFGEFQLPPMSRGASRSSGGAGTISLSTWFRDYVYIPLGGNRCSRARNVEPLRRLVPDRNVARRKLEFHRLGTLVLCAARGGKSSYGARLWSVCRRSCATPTRWCWSYSAGCSSAPRRSRLRRLTSPPCSAAAACGAAARVVYYALEFWPELLCCCIAALPVKQWLETALQKRDAAPARAVLTWGRSSQRWRCWRAHTASSLRDRSIPSSTSGSERRRRYEKNSASG